MSALSFFQHVRIDCAFQRLYCSKAGVNALLESADPVRPASTVAVLKLFIVSRSFRLAVFLRLAPTARCTVLTRLVFEQWISFFFGADISVRAQLGPGLFFPHPFGIVMGDLAVVDGHSVIFNDVTLGKKYPGRPDGQPSIGRGCMLCVGARILGPIRVGEGSLVTANAVITRDVPPRSTAFGVNQVRPGNYFREEA